ncbi:hypothetical protein DFH08DRAFT_969403 [Mycena albidolilacea]|uniref:Uncharacterized protein n=1 Tax=Mycena albidolilacea TaxID=1033008 RepID=A0AAD6ZHP1_9AGAR|nr:hypothetical protein DFH08DRAFT_969403 [Mycena albidolilacea]
MQQLQLSQTDHSQSYPSTTWTQPTSQQYGSMANTNLDGFNGTYCNGHPTQESVNYHDYGANAGGGPIYDHPGDQHPPPPGAVNVQQVAGGENGQNEHIKQQIQAQIAPEMVAIYKCIAELEGQKAQEEADEEVAKERKKCPQVITRSVSSTMRNLLGMEDAKSVVPGPLGIGELPRVDENGITLFNPTWEGNADGTQALVVATFKLVWANEQEPAVPPLLIHRPLTSNTSPTTSKTLRCPLRPRPCPFPPVPTSNTPRCPLPIPFLPLLIRRRPLLKPRAAHSAPALARAVVSAPNTRPVRFPFPSRAAYFHHCARPNPVSAHPCRPCPHYPSCVLPRPLCPASSLRPLRTLVPSRPHTAAAPSALAPHTRSVPPRRCVHPAHPSPSL